MAVKQKVKINLGTFDLIKGIAMILVIFTHMRYRYDMSQLWMLSPLYLILGLMGSSLMPMFFIISGFGFKEKSGGKMLKKTFSELIVPYLWAIAVYAVLYAVLQWPVFYSKVDLLKRMALRLGGLALGLPVQKTVLGRELATTGALWFFLALFIAENILNRIVAVKKTGLQILLTGLCIALGFLLFRVGFVYFCIPQGLMAVGCCYLGYCLKKHQLLDRFLYSRWAYAVLIPVFAVLFVWSNYSGRWFSMADGNFNLPEYLMACCCGVLFMFAGVRASHIRHSALGWIRKIGMHSYWIIIVHTLESMAMPWYEIAMEIPFQPFCFVVEAGLKVIIIMTGCQIIKKISMTRYTRKMEKNRALKQ